MVANPPYPYVIRDCPLYKLITQEMLLSHCSCINHEKTGTSSHILLVDVSWEGWWRWKWCKWRIQHTRGVRGIRTSRDNHSHFSSKWKNSQLKPKVNISLIFPLNFLILALALLNFVRKSWSCRDICWLKLRSAIWIKIVSDLRATA